MDIEVALVLVVAAAVLGVYMTITYRTQLARATQEVKVVAKLEAKAVAMNDKPSFMALQDPDNAAFRAMQDQRYWQAYLRAQAGLTPYVKMAFPYGELALECTTSQEATFYSILRIRADGSGLTPITHHGQSAFHPAWSPDGRWLAVPQEQWGVLLVAQDLSAMRRMDAPNCLRAA